ncbi:MAG: hypothetical protein ACI9ZX_001845, partial [Algoriphagus sp.]
MISINKVRRLIRNRNREELPSKKIRQKRSGIAPLNYLPLLPSGPGG